MTDARRNKVVPRNHVRREELWEGRRFEDDRPGEEDLPESAGPAKTCRSMWVSEGRKMEQEGGGRATAPSMSPMYLNVS
jgi:hypothetical protein